MFSQQIIRFISQSYFIRVKLKLKKFIRQHFINHFDKSKYFVVLWFLLIFIDEFDFYRNMYRSLIDVYFIIAAFFFRERIRRLNVFALILKSHENIFSDVTEILNALSSLNVDEILFVNQKSIFVCAFIFCYFDDMSQQNENSNFMIQNVTHYCRYCLIETKDKKHFNFNTLKHEKYHYEAIYMRKIMFELKKTA